MLVAGGEGKTGAAALAAEATGRVGAGLVTIACPAGLNDILEVKCTEAMTVPVPDTSERAFAAGAEPLLRRLAAERDVVGLGPGIGREAETLKLVRSFVPQLKQPVVLDADGLHAFADDPARLKTRQGPTVLTPHPGEASALLGRSPNAINRDRPSSARALAEVTGAVVVLKGAATLIAAPGGRLIVNPTGGPVLATGGTGDVLLGMVTGFIAQGVLPFEAAALAAWLHGFAADRISERSGPAGMLAGDLLSELPVAAQALRGAALAPPEETGLALRFPEP